MYYEIKEGQKTRTQFFKGTVIQLRGTGATKTFTIRKMSGDVGVEKYSQSTCLHFRKLKLTEEVELEDLEFITSETLEVKKLESRMLLTRKSNSDNNTYKKRLSNSGSLFLF